MIENFTKYKNVHIEKTPTDEWPDMVTIIKTTKKLAVLMDKRYIHIDKAEIAIDILRGEQMITKGKKQADKELVSLGLGDMNY